MNITIVPPMCGSCHQPYDPKTHQCTINSPFLYNKDKYEQFVVDLDTPENEELI